MTRREENKQLLLAFKRSLRDRCNDCRLTFFPEALEFDHVAGIKLHNVADMLDCTYEEIRAEVFKCELVCAGCHRVRTARRRQDAHVDAADAADIARELELV